MIDTMKELLVHQYEAALCTLNHCIEQSPNHVWNGNVARYPFSQVVFHTLFFADVYLDAPGDGFKQQPFHVQHADFFADYEQLQWHEPVSTYDKPSIRRYMSHIRQKAARVIQAETAESLSGPCGFERRNFSRAELHIYNIRHIQHHAAQLILRLRLDSDVNVPWVGTGWAIG